MTLAASIILVVFALLTFVKVAVKNSRLQINASAFMAQIQKLVMMNNIDRAIKLCNAAPSGLLSSLVKSMLVHANRTHELHLMFEEGLFTTAVVRANARKWWDRSQLLLIGGSVTVVLLISQFDPGGPSTAATVLLCVYLGLTGLSVIGVSNLHSHTKDCDLQLVQCRNMLYKRADRVPASHTPRTDSHMDPHSLKLWRHSLEMFNQGYEATKATGVELDTPQEEYDAQANEDGVLPFL